MIRVIGQLTQLRSVEFTDLDIDLEHKPEQLKSALVIAETRASAAEQLAKERAERIEDLRRMLPAPEASRKRR